MKQRFSIEQFFSWALSLGVLTTFLALSLYGYLGTFSRYGSDDYCLSAFFLQDHLFNAFIQRYFVASSRYTNILFIGLVDKLFGWYNVAILPPLMIALLVFGLYLFLKEIGEMLKLGWSRWMFLLLSLLLAYFSISQAPDLYQTIYWRAGMTSHFAPLVLIPFFGAFLLRQIRSTQQHSLSIWVRLACFIIPFLIGGLSEPPTALMITVLVLGIAAAWWRSDASRRRSVLALLAWSLGGAMAALIVMALAPANALRMQTAPPGFMELISRIVIYPSYFIADTFQALPLPTLISFLMPALLCYGKYAHSSQTLSKETRNRLGILLIAVPLFAYLFIAASFAPSAYGQSYPEPRVRFIGRLLLTGAFLMEGALLGVLAAQIKFLQSAVLRGIATSVLILLMFYPLRTTWRLSAEIPVYQQRAAAWDAREAQIRVQKAQGVQKVAVPFLRTELSQDLGDRTNFRLNRCAAALYGVDSVYAVPLKNLK